MSAVPNIDLSKGLRPFRPKPQTVNDELNQLVAEMCRIYDLSDSQVYITAQGDIWFDYEALCTLANALGDFIDISVDQEDINTEHNYITAKCIVFFSNGTSRRAFDTVFINDVKPDGTQVQDMREAISLVRARALRAVFRMADFDPVKKHQQLATGQTVEVGQKPKSQWETMNNEAHLHGETLGLIKKISGSNQKDKSRWYQQMRIFFPNSRTSRDLDDGEMSIWVGSLRALVNARNKTN